MNNELLETLDGNLAALAQNETFIPQCREYLTFT
jgi:hypothetical protein